MGFSYEAVSIFKPSLKLSNNSLNFQAEILTIELCFYALVEKITTFKQKTLTAHT
jgi:hypothetical protein